MIEEMVMTEEFKPMYGITVHEADVGKRIEVECMHQSGVLYAVPGEASWVCSADLLHVHALAGFFRELVGFDDQKIHELMQRWGLYFRPRSIPEPTENDK